MSASGIKQIELEKEIETFKEERKSWMTRCAEAKDAIPLFGAKAREIRERGGDKFADFLENVAIVSLKKTIEKCEQQIAFCMHAENRLMLEVAKLDFETQEMLKKLDCEKEWEEFMLAESK